MIRGRRPSVAGVLAAVALFVALGGSAVALQGIAGKAGAGKVKTVKENTATTAADDPCANGKTGVFCGYFDGSSVDGGWENHGAGFGKVSFSKDQAAMVHLAGVADQLSYQTGQTIFILPKGYRPARTSAVIVPCALDDMRTDVDPYVCHVFIEPNGEVVEYRHSSGAPPFGGLSLDSVSFRAR